MSFYVKTYITILVFAFLASCGNRFTIPFSSHSESREAVDIFVDISPASGGVAGMGSEDSNSFGLVSASAFSVTLAGCSSGYTATVTQANSVLTAYVGDRGCLVKLTSFTAGGVSYTPSTTHPFSTWAPGDYTYFQDASSNLIYVEIVSTLSSPVRAANTISMRFGGEVNAGSTTNILTKTESSLLGNHTDSGAFSSATFQLKVVSLSSIARSTNTANLTMTLACTTLMSANQCNSITMPSGDANYTVTYGFTPALSLSTAYTTTQLNNVTLNVTGSVLAPGASSGGITVTNGGVVTATGAVKAELHAAGYVSFIQKIVRISDSAYTYNYWNIFVGARDPAGSVSACSTTFSGGTGTSTNPYLISNATQLAAVGNSGCNSNSVYFQQINNIDLGGLALQTWASVELTGQYNGNGFSITNLYQNTSGNGGLFSTIQAGASVSNLTISSANITVTSGTGNIGILAGTMAGGSVTNVATSGTVTTTGGIYIGGLIGLVLGGTVSFASSSATVTFNVSSVTSQSAAGGLMGALGANNGAITLTNSFATGNVNTPGGSISGSGIIYGSGGLVGLLGGNGTYSISLGNCYATGNQTLAITGTNTNNYQVIGGFVGIWFSPSTTITGCYSSGALTIAGTSTTNIYIGGFVGSTNSSGGTISDSYTMATVTTTGTNSGVGAEGGFIGGTYNTPPALTITNCYSANPSIGGSGANSNNGFIGVESSVPTITNSYYYQTASNPTNVYTTGVTTYTTATQMQTQTNFSGFTFGTSSTNNWQMPTTNPLAANGGLLSPVQLWQCGVNGIVCSNPCVASFFASGAGTSGSPYIVSNATQLQASSNCTSSSTYFKQSQDINLGGASFPTWVPMALGGQYNGNNYKIRGLYVNNTTGGVGSGLFGSIGGGASVSNLKLQNADVTAIQYVGILAGLMGTGSASASVTNCSSSGTLQLNPPPSPFPYPRAGGLIGEIITGTVSSSSSSVDVTWASTTTNGADNVGVGGLVGVLRSVAAASSITDSFATGNVNVSGTTASANVGVGSLVGSGDIVIGQSISNSYATGNVTSTLDGTTSTGKIQGYGGILGLTLDMTNFTISGCYSSGTYSAVGTTNTNIQIGGLVGWIAAASSGASVTNSYSMATLVTTGTFSAGVGAMGGLIGNAFGQSAGALTISTSYAANPSISGTGVAYSRGFFGFQGANAPTVSTSYYYDNTNTPANFYTSGVTTYTTEAEFENVSNFGGLTFGTASDQNWQMPIANSIASPTTFLSPVLHWQCTGKGTVNTAICQ